jgi:soluble lytic murein transglycosylase-like protein
LPESVARFGAAIEFAATAHHVDPALLSVMVLVESRGNPDAVSPHGALGLMQVMPATAVLIADERGLPAPTREQLVDPVYNLDFGAYYVAQQLASFADRPEPERVKLAAMAYNGGPRALGNYLAGVAELYRETVLYSELVTRLWQDRNAEASATYQTLK